YIVNRPIVNLFASLQVDDHMYVQSYLAMSFADRWLTSSTVGSVHRKSLYRFKKRKNNLRTELNKEMSKM
ncbi:MAG: hypothetical protein LIP08_15470, partial [Bacteroides sp.]|nr:hypothetical protein [Bacteroides sp.]